MAKEKAASSEQPCRNLQVLWYLLYQLTQDIGIEGVQVRAGYVSGTLVLRADWRGHGGWQAYERRYDPMQLQHFSWPEAAWKRFIEAVRHYAEVKDMEGK